MGFAFIVIKNLEGGPVQPFKLPCIKITLLVDTVNGLIAVKPGNVSPPLLGGDSPIGILGVVFTQVMLIGAPTGVAVNIIAGTTSPGQ